MNSRVAKSEEIIEDIKNGKMVILVDEEDRENEGDLMVAAQFASPENINFMATHGRGLICLTLTKERCGKLGLPLMVGSNRSRMGTNFTVSIEAAEGVTTGISAADRAHTIITAVDQNTVAKDIVQPGHVFPLRAEEGGVLVRAGHTEAGCDIASLAGLSPSAVICEILKENGEMARLPDLEVFAKEHDLKIGTITDLIDYRSRTETLIQRVFTRKINTTHGEFQLIGYEDKISQDAHFAMLMGNPGNSKETFVRVHEPLSVMDLMDISNQRHSWNLNDAMHYIASQGEGVIVLLHRTENGHQLLDRFSSNGVGKDKKVPLRTYGIGAQILRDVSIRKMKLLATPRRMPSMSGFGLEVTGYVEKPID